MTWPFKPKAPASFPIEDELRAAAKLMGIDTPPYPMTISEGFLLQAKVIRALAEYLKGGT